MRHLRHVGLAVVTLMVATSAASAQRARSGSQNLPWEFGVDAGLQMELGVPTGASKTTVLVLPVPSVRAGFFVNDEWSLEPSLFYDYNKTEGTPSSSDYALGFAGLYHFQKNRNARQMYLRPFFLLLGSSGGGGASTTDQAIGAGVGLKWPRLNGRIAWRGEANLARQMDAEITSLNFMWGMSVFTR